MKKVLFFLLLALLMTSFVACGKGDKVESTDAVENAESAETAGAEGTTGAEDQRATIAAQLSKTTLDAAKVGEAIQKLPKWIEISRKYAEQLQAIQDLGQVNDVSFVDKVPGMKEDLAKAGIDAEAFFPLLEKTLQGHMFLKSKEMFETRKDEYEKNKAQIAEMIDAPDATEEMKQQYQQMLTSMEQEAEMLKGTPPGFTEAEIKLIEDRKGEIDKIIEDIQKQAQAEMARNPQQQQAPPK